MLLDVFSLSDFLTGLDFPGSQDLPGERQAADVSSSSFRLPEPGNHTAGNKPVKQAGRGPKPGPWLPVAAAPRPWPWAFVASIFPISQTRTPGHSLGWEILHRRPPRSQEHALCDKQTVFSIATSSGREGRVAPEDTFAVAGMLCDPEGGDGSR